jgi:hypothetical protein
MKIFALLSFIFSMVALLLTWNSPCTGFESSIYSATPLVFWVAITLDIVCGIVIIVHQVSSGKHTQSRFWVIGLLLIGFAYTSLMALWIIRGYVQWGTGDPLSHIKLTSYIINDGHFQLNFYPIAHIYLSEFTYLLNISDTVIYNYITLLFYVFYILFFYVMVKSLFSSKGTIILATLAGITLVYVEGIGFAPNTLANLFLPFAIFLFAKSSPSGNNIWKALFMVIIFLFPPFHPVPSLALLLIIVFIAIPDIIINSNKRNMIPSNGIFSFRTPVFLFLLVWSIFWFSSFGVWTIMVNDIKNYFSGISLNHLVEINQQIQYANEYQYNVVVYFFKEYGVLLAYIIISLIAIPIIIKKASANSDERSLWALYGPLFIIALTIIVLLLLNVDFGPLRLLVYLSLIGAMFVGFIFNKLLEWSRSKTGQFAFRFVFTGLVTLFLLVAFFGGILKLYPSKYTLEMNDQVTRTEIRGMEWFFYKENLNEPITGLSIQTERYADYVLSPEEKTEHKYIKKEQLGAQEDQPMPWHFSYDNYSSLGAWYTQTSYMIIIRSDRVRYRDVFPEIENIRFTAEDFNQIENDQSVSKLYTNGGFDVYEVKVIES